MPSQHYSICWRRERGKCNICFAVGAFGLSNVPQQVDKSECSFTCVNSVDLQSQVPYTSSGPTDWTKLAGFTDSICCTKDNPLSNCETSGANDFIEITGAAEPPVSDVFKASSVAATDQKLGIALSPGGRRQPFLRPMVWDCQTNCQCADLHIQVASFLVSQEQDQ